MNWKTPITLLVLLAVLLGGAYYGWQTLFAAGDDSRTTATETTASSGCAQRAVYPRGAVVRAKNLRVNVFNAGSRSGLAGDTLASLVRKGFREGKASNGSDGLRVTNVTVVSRAEGDPKAALVAQQFKGHVRTVVRPVTPGTRGINIYVGDAFKRVEQKAPVQMKLKEPIRLCIVG